MATLPRQVRRFATSTAIRMGPRNLLVRAMLARACGAHGARIRVLGDVVEIRKDGRVMLIAARHFAYAIDMSKQFDLYFNTVVPERRGGALVVDFSRPGVHRYARSGLDFELSAFPEEEDVIEQYLTHYRPEQGDTVFDLGAHCGVSTYFLSQSVGPTGRVIAFEPDRISYEILLRNIERHRLSNVTPVRKAVAARSGTAKFYSEGTIGSILVENSTRATMGVEELVVTTSLADACRVYGTPSYIKMDIEGTELDAISAAMPFLRDHPIHFTVDTHHFVDGMLTGGRLEALFRACGYEAETAEIEGYMTTFARPVSARTTESLRRKSEPIRETASVS